VILAGAMRAKMGRMPITRGSAPRSNLWRCGRADRWPPVAWGLAVIIGLALNWLLRLPFLPADVAASWLGAMVFVLALALVAWAIVTITWAGSNVPTNLPTTRADRIASRATPSTSACSWVLATAFDNLLLLMMLVPFALVIRYRVVAREEAYLDRKFSDVYRGYRSRVRCWL